MSTTGSDAQAQLARMRAVATARYKLKTVPSRAEELQAPQGHRRISIVSGGMGQIRVRTQDGRVWLQTQDFQVEPSQDGPAAQFNWHQPLIEWLDKHFTHTNPLAQ